MILSVGRQILKSGKIIGGLAILEDANHGTAHLEAVPVENMEDREKELLELAKSWKGNIPVPAVDILIVDEIGKNFSGAGMDTKVVNRNSRGLYNPWPDTPRVKRVFIRDLSPHSYGNGIGIGMADAVTDRLIEKIDWEPTRTNCAAASLFAPMRVPMHFPSDRECLETLAPSVGKLDTDDVTYCRIANSMQLDHAIVSENLVPAVKQRSDIEVLGGPEPMRFDTSGNLAGEI